MPADRFFIDSDFHSELILQGQELHHLHVMRPKAGDEIELVNGKGSLVKAKITEINKKKAALLVVESIETQTPNPKVHLGVPLMRPSKLELVVEKCIELGADAFHLYVAEFSEKNQMNEHQMQRLANIAISAMKQCGRLDLPPVTYYSSLDDLLGLKLKIYYGDPEKQTTSKSISTPSLVISGPEKGFSKAELQKLKEAGEAISLGPFVLRAETAPIAATCKMLI